MATLAVLKLEAIEATVAAYIAAIFLVVAVVRAISLLDLGTELGPISWVRIGADMEQMRAIAAGNAFHMVTQFAVLAGFPLAILLFERAGLNHETAELFIAQALGTLATGVLQPAIQPLSAAVADATEHADSVWIRSIVKWYLGLSTAFIAFGGVTVLVAGARIANSLFGDVAPSATALVVLVLGVGVANVSSTFYYVLVGAGIHRRAALSMIPGALVAIAVVVVAVKWRSVELAVAGAVIPANLLALLGYRPVVSRFLGGGR